MLSRLRAVLLALCAVPLLVPALAHGLNITGAGASFPYPVYAYWAYAYRDLTDRLVNYQSIGSGGGVAQITRGTVDFGASDAPLSGQELAERGLMQFPAVMGGTVPVVNLPGIAPGELKLSGTELADIYLGKIRKWNDPVLVARNPGVALPDADILVVYRSDGSGTTYGWTHYLAQVSPEWASNVGVGKAVKWPTGQGGKGNEGVANYVRQLQYTIGFVEYGFARQSQLSHVALENRDGNFVQPNAESFMAAAADADWDAEPGMGLMLTYQPGAQAWPIAAATFILVPAQPRSPERVKAVFAFFDWAFREGDAIAERLHYVALPDNVADLVRQRWRQEVQPRNGAAAWP